MLVERDLDERRDDVGDQHLLRQADDEDAGADRRAAQRVPARIQLARDGLVADDGPGDQLREQGDVERDLDRIAIGPEPAPVDVDDVGQAVEGEEGDAQRQMDMGRSRPPAPNGGSKPARLAVTKFAYLKTPRTSRFPATATASATRRAPSRIVDGQGRKEVEGDREEQNNDEPRLSPCVEHQGEQQGDEVLAPDCRGYEIERQEDRQEEEQEGYRRKDHYRKTARPACLRLECASAPMAESDSCGPVFASF